MKPYPSRHRSGAPFRRLAGTLFALALLGGWACAAQPDAETAPPPAERAAPAPAPEAPEAAPAPAPLPTGGGALEAAAGEAYKRSQEEEAEDEDELERALRELEMQAKAGEGQPAPATPPQPEPPDGKWLVDDEGREYFVKEVAKVEGRYRRLEDGRVRLPGGFAVDVAGETEDAFLVKIYKVEPVAPPPSDAPTPEQIAAVEAAHEASLPTRNTLSFRELDRGLPRGGQWRNGFDVADINGDGHLDIVHGPPRKGFTGPFLFLGDGAGGWRQWEGASLPEAPYDYGDAEAADFDGDGHEDLAFAVHLGGLIAMRGDGEGHFERWSQGLTLVPGGTVDPEVFVTRTVAAVDWDDDGLLDLVALSEGPRHPKATERQDVTTPDGLAVFRNNGDGSWTNLGRLGEAAGLFGDSLAVGDFDADGRIDLVAGSNAIGRRELLFLNREGSAVESAKLEAIPPGAIVWSVGVADFDGDGRDDLAVAATGYEVQDWWGSLQVLLNRPAEDGGLAFTRVLLAGGRDNAAERVTALGTGDLDGDGRADLVASTATGDVRVFLGDGEGGFHREEAGPVEEPSGCRGYHVRLADLDSDGRDEIVASFAGDSCPGAGSLRVWKPVPE